MFLKLLLFVLYLTIIILLICKLKIFRKTKINSRYLVLIFGIKLIAGLGLNYLYLHYYTDTKEADIYKYYQDSETLYNIAQTDFSAFLKIMSGINSKDTALNVYYEQLYNWQEHDSKYLEIIGYQDSNFFNSHRFVTKLNVAFHFLSQSYLPTHTLFMCFISFIGFTLIFLSFSQFASKHQNTLLILGIYLFPSVLMWSGTLLKESILYFGIGLFTYSIFHQQSSIKKLILFVFASVILIYIKFYILIILLISTILFFTYKNHKKSIYYILSLFVLIFLISIYLLPTKLNPLVYISSKMQQQQKIGMGGYYLCKTDSLDFQVFIEENEFEKHNFYNNDSIHATFTAKGKLFHYFFLPENINYNPYFNGTLSDTSKQLGNMHGWYFLMLHYAKANSFIPIPELEPNLLSFIRFFPYTIKNSILEPIPRASNFTILHLASFIENLFLLLLILLTILFIKKPLPHKEIILFLIVFSLLLLLLIGYTTPIAGNIIRHKIPSITFLIISIIIMLDIEKIKKLKR